MNARCIYCGHLVQLEDYKYYVDSVVGTMTGQRVINHECAEFMVVTTELKNYLLARGFTRQQIDRMKENELDARAKAFGFAWYMVGQHWNDLLSAIKRKFL